ncbi:MAG: 6-phosphofructokinase [Anaerolineales bacterium]|nr:6-phosphofructokinase [Anaerolineales bacterium]MCB9127802.1 6-phosphofructokinase [Ardenticatenales bacterium]
MENEQRIRRIGLLTGGGDAPGLNAVIRAVTLTAILQEEWEVVGIRRGFEGLLHDNPHVVALTQKRVEGLLPRGGTVLGAASHNNPRLFEPSENGPIVSKWAKAQVRRQLDALAIDALVIIGGDGTMTMGQQFFEAGIPLVGVPKTIDNDLLVTELTFGFDSALDQATDALDRLHTTAESHDRVMVMEVMGRNSGWIALHAGVAGSADVILIPELPFTLAAIGAKIREQRDAGRLYSIVVVAEGATPAEGDQLYREFGDERSLGGIGHWLAAQLAESLGVATRAVVLGHLQRGGSPSAFDRNLATMFGASAVRLIAKRKFGYMTALQCGDIVSVPIIDAIGEQKKVSLESKLVHTAEGLGISFGI